MSSPHLSMEERQTTTPVFMGEVYPAAHNQWGWRIRENAEDVAGGGGYSNEEAAHADLLMAFEGFAEVRHG